MSDLINRQAVIDALTKTSGIRGDALKALYDLPSVENKGDLISRERLINEWDDLGRRYAMPTTPIHKRAFREFPSADMRGKSCNTCKNNDDDEISGECYECIKGIFDHYEPKGSEE